MKKLIYLLCILTFASCNILNKSIIRYEVMSDGMIPAIYPGDYIYVNTTISEFTYGDIIVYRYPGDSILNMNDRAFRIVGLPGDSFAIEDEICIINNRKNNTEYIGEDNFDDIIQEEFPNGAKVAIYKYQNKKRNDDLKTIKIPENYYYILGDTRMTSVDGRYFGPVAKKDIVGKVVKIVSNQ